MRTRATLRRGHAHTTTVLPHHEYNSNNNNGSWKSSLGSANLRHQRRRIKRKSAKTVCIGVRRILLYSKTFLVSTTTKNNIARKQRYKLLRFLFGVALLLLTFVVRYSRGHSRNNDARRPTSMEELMQLPIALYNNEKIVGGQVFFPLPPLSDEFEKDKDDADFGGLGIEFLKEGERRTIVTDPYDMEGSVHTPNLNLLEEDDVDENWMYLAHDDDLVRAKDLSDDSARKEDTDAGPVAGNDSEDGAIKNHCRRTNYHKLHFPNCNTIHEEVFVLDNLPNMIGQGAYRQGHILKRPPSVEDNPLMFKQNLMTLAISEENFEFTRMDALVSERLTAYPNIVDIYGHCGVSILSEFFEAGTLDEYILGGRDGAIQDSELNDSKDVDPQNNLSIKEKISTALEMAESIATLHGYYGGVMTHQDIKPDQFLVKNDGTIKLNDFNRAEIMLFDETKDEYCRYKEGPGNGDFRSPEEYNDYNLNEKVDVYSMGNNIYVLLTGLYPFYNYQNYDDVKKDVAEGIKPFVDARYRTRSVEEGALVEIMERCWETNPDDRASIFEVVKFLRNLEEKANADRKNLRQKFRKKE